MIHQNQVSIEVLSNHLMIFDLLIIHNFLSSIPIFYLDTNDKHQHIKIIQEIKSLSLVV